MCPTDGQIAQLVEQGTENPCVSGSIPLLATSFILRIFSNIASIPLKIPLLSGSIPRRPTSFLLRIFILPLFLLVCCPGLRIVQYVLPVSGRGHHQTSCRRLASPMAGYLMPVPLAQIPPAHQPNSLPP